MATNVAPPLPSAREYRRQELHYTRRTVGFADSTFVMPASLPAGALVTRTLVLIETPFTGGTSPTLIVGTAPGGSDIVAAADSVVATAGAKRPDTGTLKGRVATDQPLYGTITGGPTAGVATLVFEYAPNNDG